MNICFWKKKKVWTYENCIADIMNKCESIKLDPNKDYGLRVDNIKKNEILYKDIASRIFVICEVKIPWQVIGVIHYRESSCDTHTHLHNGDPLSARTKHVPAGRPKEGNPPFTFMESAVDALTLEFEGLNAKDYTTLEDWLFFCERYNGFGYRSRGLNSPYVWGWTNHQSKGMFVADGKFDSSKLDPRPGCAALLKYMYG